MMEIKKRRIIAGQMLRKMVPHKNCPSYRNEHSGGIYKPTAERIVYFPDATQLCRAATEKQS